MATNCLYTSVHTLVQTLFWFVSVCVCVCACACVCVCVRAWVRDVSIPPSQGQSRMPPRPRPIGAPLLGTPPMGMPYTPSSVHSNPPFTQSFTIHSLCDVFPSLCVCSDSLCCSSVFVSHARGCRSSMNSRCAPFSLYHSTRPLPLQASTSHLRVAAHPVDGHATR